MLHNIYLVKGFLHFLIKILNLIKVYINKTKVGRMRLLLQIQARGWYWCHPQSKGRPLLGRMADVILMTLIHLIHLPLLPPLVPFGPQEGELGLGHL